MTSTEKKKEQDRRRYQRHRKERLEHDKRYRLNNRDKIKKHQEEHREEYNKTHREYKQALKREILSYYCNSNTPFCIICKEDRIDCLSLDHINNNGAEERRLRGKSGLGRSLYIRLKKEGFPRGFQTLCMNCQYIKELQRRREILDKN